MPGTRKGSTRTRKPANAAFLDKEPAASHQTFADFIAETTGHIVPVGDVALVQRLYPVYLKSPAIVKAKQAEKEERERQAKAKADEKARRNKERLAALEEQAARLRRELGIETDDAVGQVLSLVPSPVDEGSDEPEADEVADEEPTTLVLAESEDNFVEAEDADEADDDLWEDNDTEVEDF